VLAGESRGVVAEAALQILIPYGNTERPDKLRKLYILLAGWTAIKICPNKFTCPM
jgi:hypothetical protein